MARIAWTSKECRHDWRHSAYAANLCCRGVQLARQGKRKRQFKLADKYGVYVICKSADQDSPPSGSAQGTIEELDVDAARRELSAPTTDIEESLLKKIEALLLLLSPFFFWGTSMVAMKALSPHTAPLFVSAVRMLPAGLALILWGLKDNRPQPTTTTAWLWIAAFGLADATCFQGFLAEGLQRTSAGLGSVIIDSQPLSVAILASILFGETLTASGYVGLFAGLFGLVLLEVSPDAISTLITSGPTTDVLPDLSSSWSLWDSGEWWMLLAAQSMAVGTVLVRYVTKHADPIMATGYHMLLGGVPLLILSAQQEASLLSDRLPQLTGLDYALLCYISLLGSAASYGVFFYNATKGNLTALSSLTFSTPCFAAATGFLAFGETLTPLQLLGATITLGGVVFINRTPSEKSD